MYRDDIGQCWPAGLPVIMTRWFQRNLGIVMGVYWAAQGMGPVIFAPLFRWLLENQGWQHTFTLIGNLCEIKGEVIYVVLAYRKAA